MGLPMVRVAPPGTTLLGKGVPSGTNGIRQIARGAGVSGISPKVAAGGGGNSNRQISAKGNGSS